MNDGTLLGIALGGLFIHNQSQKKRMESLEQAVRESRYSLPTREVIHEVTHEVVREIEAEHENTGPNPYEELARLQAQLEVAELYKDCGYSNCPDFGSADITYGASWLDVQPQEAKVETKVKKAEPAFQDPALWGKSVAEAFPSAHGWIKEANNLLAAAQAKKSGSTETAAVFHTAAVLRLLRLAGNGFITLAKYLKVKPEKSPASDAERNMLVEQVKNAVAQMELKHQSNKRKYPKLEFCRNAMVEFNAIMSICGNDLTNTGRYDRQTALAVYAHTRSFMQLLAQKVHEVIVIVPNTVKPPEPGTENTASA